MDLRQVDLNLLVVLDRLLATGSVTRAARALGIGQPAASKALDRLRAQLGDPLLVRAGRAMVLTEHATALRPRVTAALEAAEAAFAPLAPFDPATATGAFTLALAEDASIPLLAPLVARLRTAAPGVDLRVRSLHRGSADDLEHGRLDLGVLPDLRRLPGFDVPSLDALVLRPLLTDHFVVVAREPRPMTLPDFLAAGHALCTGQGDRGLVDELLAARGLRRRVVATAPTFHLVAHLVGRSDLVATMPAHVARAAGPHLARVPTPIPLPELPMLVAWHPRRQRDPRHRFLRALLDEVAAEVEADPRP